MEKRTIQTNIQATMPNISGSNYGFLIVVILLIILLSFK